MSRFYTRFKVISIGQTVEVGRIVTLSQVDFVVVETKYLETLEKGFVSMLQRWDTAAAK